MVKQKSHQAVLVFFLRLGCDEETPQNDSDSDSDSDTPDLKDALMAHKINKKSRKRQRWLENIKKKAKKAKRSDKAPSFNFSALHLIHDPQTMAEKLLKRFVSASNASCKSLPSR